MLFFVQKITEINRSAHRWRMGELDKRRAAVKAAEAQGLPVPRCPIRLDEDCDGREMMTCAEVAKALNVRKPLIETWAREGKVRHETERREVEIACAGGKSYMKIITVNLVNLEECRRFSQVSTDAMGRSKEGRGHGRSAFTVDADGWGRYMAVSRATGIHQDTLRGWSDKGWIPSRCLPDDPLVGFVNVADVERFAATREGIRRKDRNQAKDWKQELVDGWKQPDKLQAA